MVTMRVAAGLLWAGGALWVWVLLRARHAVTLGVMLTMVSHRAIVDVGSGSVYWLSVLHAGIAAILVLGSWCA